MVLLVPGSMYIPVENGDARWVVIHTLVIENQLGQPCLQDSYFRFHLYLRCIQHSTNNSTTIFI